MRTLIQPFLNKRFAKSSFRIFVMKTGKVFYGPKFPIKKKKAKRKKEYCSWNRALIEETRQFKLHSPQVWLNGDVESVVEYRFR